MSPRGELSLAFQAKKAVQAGDNASEIIEVGFQVAVMPGDGAFT